MADVSVKMGVSGIQQFKSAMSDAQTSIKTLDAALKLNEKSLKAGANAEKTMEASATLLNAKMKEQKKIADNATAALKKMDQDGVEPTSKAYQEMQRRLIEAQSAMMDTQDALNNLGQAAVDTAGKTNKVESSLNGISKKVSFDAVIKGIDTITSGLEKAAQTAVQVGESIWNNIVNSAKWADDATTLAQVYEIPLERYLQLEALVASGLDTSVDAIVGSMNKLKKNVGGGATATMDALKSLGLVVTEHGGKIEEGFDRLVTEDAEDLFWQAGKAIMAMDDAFDKEATAQAIFGKSWRELIPLFERFNDKESFNETLDTMNTNSEEAVENLADLNDALGALQHDFDVLKNEVLAGLAPALTDAANALSGLLQRVMEYLKTPEGQQAIQRMSDAISGLFEDLSNIDPDKVVESFATVFGKIVEGFGWIKENWGAVKAGIFGIAAAFGGLKIASVGLNIANAVSGLKNLLGAGAGAAGAAAGGGAVSTAAKAGATGQIARKLKDVGGYVLPVAEVAGVAYAAYDLVYGSMERAMESWSDDARKRIAELGRQESSFTAESDSALVNAWKEIREHANDEGFLDELAKRYFMFDQSADVTSGYWDYEDPFWDPVYEAYYNGQVKDETYDRLTEMMGKILRKQNMQAEGWTGGWEDLDLMDTMDLLNQVEAELAAAANEKPPEIQIDPIVPEDASDQIAEQVGMVYIPAQIYYVAQGGAKVPTGNSYSSNLYVENMNMNGGMDAAGLADAINSRNRRVMKGYGNGP